MPWTLDMAQDLEDGDRLLLIDPMPAIQICASTNIAMELAIKVNEKKDKKLWKETVLEYLHDFANVFEKQDFDELPPHRPWDHAIELVSGSENRLDCKIYPLSVVEQEQLNKFIDENLRTGWIHSSKSPIASSFFFIKKKDRAL